MRRGLLAEFETPEALLEAARGLRESGFTRLSAFTPYPMEGLEEELGLRRSRIPVYVLLAALVGAGLAFLVQYWANGVSYPLDVGGRPLFSWPAFVPITFEMAVLAGAFAAVIGVLAGSGLPRLWHPLFQVEGFERATVDRFFLGVDRADPRFAPERLARELRDMGALRVVAVGVT
jgi:hypothetical protein